MTHHFNENRVIYPTMPPNILEIENFMKTNLLGINQTKILYVYIFQFFKIK